MDVGCTNKIWIHEEIIQERGKKIQFQINLPEEDYSLMGVKAESSAIGIGETPPKNNSPYAGWLSLRVANKADLFYHELVKFNKPVEEPPNPLAYYAYSISEEREWWFGGTKEEFFKVNIPLQNNIVDGFFEDYFRNEGQDYRVRIYLWLRRL